MKPKKSASLLLADVVAASALSGCEQNAAQNNDGRVSIGMYMWDSSMFKELYPWLETLQGCLAQHLLRL